MTSLKIAKVPTTSLDREIIKVQAVRVPEVGESTEASIFDAKDDLGPSCDSSAQFGSTDNDINRMQFTNVTYRFHDQPLLRRRPSGKHTCFFR